MMGCNNTCNFNSFQKMYTFFILVELCIYVNIMRSYISELTLILSPNTLEFEQVIRQKPYHTDKLSINEQFNILVIHFLVDLLLLPYS